MQIGRYQVVRELGRGAMGIVYEAHDPLIGRTVAIFAIAGAFVIWRFNILGLRDFGGNLASRVVSQPAE